MQLPLQLPMLTPLFFTPTHSIPIAGRRLGQMNPSNYSRMCKHPSAYNPNQVVTVDFSSGFSGPCESLFPTSGQFVNFPWYKAEVCDRDHWYGGLVVYVLTFFPFAQTHSVGHLSPMNKETFWWKPKNVVPMALRHVNHTPPNSIPTPVMEWKTVSRKPKPKTTFLRLTTWNVENVSCPTTTTGVVYAMIWWTATAMTKTNTVIKKKHGALII